MLAVPCAIQCSTNTCLKHCWDSHGLSVVAFASSFWSRMQPPASGFATASVCAPVHNVSLCMHICCTRRPCVLRPAVSGPDPALLRPWAQPHKPHAPSHIAIQYQYTAFSSIYYAQSHADLAESAAEPGLSLMLSVWYWACVPHACAAQQQLRNADLWLPAATHTSAIMFRST